MTHDPLTHFHNFHHPQPQTSYCCLRTHCKSFIFAKICYYIDGTISFVLRNVSSVNTANPVKLIKTVFQNVSIRPATVMIVRCTKWKIANWLQRHWPTVLSYRSRLCHSMSSVCLSVVCDVVNPGKTAGPICMKFSGKVWTDHGTTWLHFGSIRRNRTMPRY